MRPRLAQLAFLCVLAFLLTTKVWSPQYSLWLVPLLALARPRWRLTLVWQFTEIAVWMLTLTDAARALSVPDHGISYGWLMLRPDRPRRLLLVLAALVVREMWCPWLDVVRVDGADDPGRRRLRRRTRPGPPRHRSDGCSTLAAAGRPRTPARPAGVRSTSAGSRCRPPWPSAARRLDDDVAAGGAAHVGDDRRVDLTGAEVGVPVGAGVERVAAVVGVHEVDAAGDGQHAVDDAGQVLAAGVRVTGVEAEADAELADRVPQPGQPVEAAGHGVVAAGGVLDEHWQREPAAVLGRAGEGLAPVVDADRRVVASR